MKRILATAMMLLAVLAVAAQGASAPKATGGGHWISGAGMEIQGSFTAQPDASGGKGKVNVRVDKGDPDEFSYKGTVTCYEQDGDIARFSGTITKSDGIESEYFSWTISDGGEPGAGVDMVRTRRSINPIDCRTETLTPINPLVRGNFQVRP